jgi:CDP-4-dehydro-6-deoxyglucose reductase
MSFTVRNDSNGSEFAVNDGESILDAALRQGHIFPYSCRDGLCASCKADLVHGRVEYGEYQQTALNDVEIGQGKVLLCQARPLENVVIKAQEIAAAANIEIRILPCRVTRLKPLAHDVMEMHLTLPQERTLSYLAGQYIDILLRDGRRRSFSLAAQPGNQILQLHVRRVPDGRFTNHVFERMKERDLLRLQGPLGTFFLRADSDRPTLLMAGGTGFAPIKSILEQAFADGITRPMHLFWGVRSRRDLYFDELAQDWMQSNPEFQYTPVLSEPVPQDQWQGEIGWVHDAVLQHYPDLSQHEVYASGPPPMIDAGKLAFGAHGLPEDRLFFDSFEFANEPRRRV